jgi:hypothetical protein
MQRLLVVIFGEEAFRRHWRQDIGQGHAHGALYQRKAGARETCPWTHRRESGAIGLEIMG